MCGRFTGLTCREVEDAVRAVQERRALQPLSPDVGAARAHMRPTSQVAAICPDLGREAQSVDPLHTPMFSARDFTWGFTFEWHKGPVFNTRAESLLAGAATWRVAARNGRCVVPAAAFFEPHATQTYTNPRTGRTAKRQYRFASPDGTPLLLAGVSADGACSVVTTEPNAWVAPVHNRMPLVLSPEEAALWLGADGLEALSLLADRSAFALSCAAEAVLAADGGRAAGEVAGAEAAGAEAVLAADGGRAAGKVAGEARSKTGAKTGGFTTADADSVAPGGQLSLW